MIEAVLFDLDGTLADTARDLGAALNRLRLEANQDVLPLDVLRPHASHGVRGLLGVGFGLQPADPQYAEKAERFLAHYESALCVDTTLFDGVDEVLDRLEAEGVAWGIVTNKRQRFTLPLLERMGMVRRPGCIVSGDSAPRPKPHADPLLLASRLLGVAPQACIYVGDDHRDMIAAQAAGMTPVAAGYGYLGSAAPIGEWGAAHILGQAVELIEVLLRSRYTPERNTVALV